MADEAKSPGADGATTVTEVDAELRAAIEEVLDHVDEWVYDDNPPHTYCPSCLWDSRRDQRTPGLDHKPGCTLRAAKDLIRARLGL